MFNRINTYYGELPAGYYRQNVYSIRRNEGECQHIQRTLSCNNAACIGIANKIRNARIGTKHARRAALIHPRQAHVSITLN